MRDRYASLREGLVGAWIPSISGSGLLLPDLSGQGNNGTLTNMGPEDWVSGQYGRALDFDGVDDYVTCSQGNVNIASGDLAFTAWLRPTQWVGTGNEVYITLIEKRLSSAANTEFALWFNGAGDLHFINIGGTFTDSNIDLSIPEGSWSFLYVQRKAGIVHAAINGGVLLGGLSVIGTTASTAALVIGGQDAAHGSSSFNGQLDDIRIYNRALSESEIKLLSQEPGVGFKRSRRVFDFGRKPAYLPPTPPDYRTVRVKQTEHASLREGLVGAWCPSVAGEGYTLPDLSGRGNNGTLTNMGPEDWVSGQYGRALDFDGVDDYTNCGNILNSTFAGSQAKFTICAWLKTTVNANQIFISKLDGTLNQRQFFLRANDDGLDFTWYGTLALPATFRVVRAPLVFSSAGWVPVAVTFDATISNADQKASLYLYGSQQSISIVSSSGSPTEIQSGTAPLSFGCFFNNSIPALLFTGKLDDIRIYNRALSESEIKLLASRPGIGLRPQRRSMYYAPPTGARRRRILTSMP